MTGFWAFDDDTNNSNADFIFPHITIRALCNMLSYQGYEFVSIPEDDAAQVLWYESCVNGPLCPYSLDTENVLRLRSGASALEFLESDERGFVMVMLEDDEASEAFSPFLDRAILTIPPQENKLEARSNLQRVFLDLLIWENRLNYSTVNESSLEELLDIGASLLCHFMFVCELNGCVVSSTTRITPPNVECQAIADDHVLPMDIRSLLFRNKGLDPCATEITILDSDSGVSYACRPLVFKKALYGYLCTAIPRATMHPGFFDEFKRFGLYAEKLAYRHWVRMMDLHSPYFTFLTALLDGTEISTNALDDMEESCKIPKGSDFKLIAVDLKKSMEVGVENVVSGLELMHDGRSLIFGRGKHLLSLCFGNVLGAKLSHNRTIDDFDRYIYSPYGLKGASSQVFSDLSDLDLAYRQIQFIDKYRDAVIMESKTIGEQTPNAIYFEMIFSFLTADQVDLDRKFMRFCYSHSVPHSVATEDLITGSSKFALLWFFLVYERNASIVAKKLFMHRNTVLYHIKQIEKHYDIDLSNHFIRDKMKADFKVYFMRMTEEVHDKLFRIPMRGKENSTDPSSHEG